MDEYEIITTHVKEITMGITLKGRLSPLKVTGKITPSRNQSHSRKTRQDKTRLALVLFGYSQDTQTTSQERRLHET